MSVLKNIEIVIVLLLIIENSSEIIAAKRKKNLGVVEFKQLKLSKSSLKPNEEPSPDLC